MLCIKAATPSDVPALSELIPLSARALSRGYYSEPLIESAILHVFGPDSRLIADGTYFAAFDGEALVGCGGWSRRRTLYGGDQMKAAAGRGNGRREDDPLLDPATEPARIRAFFVHPDHARRGVGSLILRSCLDAARQAGFRRITLASTLPGVALYRAFGFEERERFEIPLPDGLSLPVILMERDVDSPPLPAGEGRG